MANHTPSLKFKVQRYKPRHSLNRRCYLARKKLIVNAVDSSGDYGHHDDSDKDIFKNTEQHVATDVGSADNGAREK